MHDAPLAMTVEGLTRYLVHNLDAFTVGVLHAFKHMRLMMHVRFIGAVSFNLAFFTL